LLELLTELPELLLRDGELTDDDRLELLLLLAGALALLDDDLLLLTLDDDELDLEGEVVVAAERLFVLLLEDLLELAPELTRVPEELPVLDEPLELFTLDSLEFEEDLVAPELLERVAEELFLVDSALVPTLDELERLLFSFARTLFLFADRVATDDVLVEVRELLLIKSCLLRTLLLLPVLLVNDELGFLDA
jgi:hypothetical protein